LKAWEAIMSSPIHLNRNANPELIYGPPRARERIVATAGRAPDSAGRSATRELSLAKSRPQFRGDRAILELQRQLARNPGLIPEPISEGDAIIRPLLIRLCSVIAVAAFVAWALTFYSDVKKTAQVIPANSAASAMASNHGLADLRLLPLRQTSQTDEALTLGGKSASDVLATAGAAAVAPSIAPVTGAARVDKQSSAPQSRQQASDRRALRLDSDEIAALVKRGQDFIASGDLAAARLLLRRAAEAGSAEAALTLGTTYDPVMLHRLGAIGTTADPAQARHWYQFAAELGSTAASQQLAGLGDPH
jgi:hypothetical protein